MSEQKILILIVSPNDSRIGEAVRSWEERGYNVATYTISNLDSVTGINKDRQYPQ